MWTSGCTVLILAAVAHAQNGLPSYIKPCARSDPNFNACALDHAKKALHDFLKGDSNFKIPTMDPLEISQMVVNEGNKRNGYTLTMKNVKMYGLMGAQLRKTDYDFNRRHVLYDTQVPRLEILSEYEISGKMLILPVSGKGDLNITLGDNRLTFSHDYVLKNIKGVDYMKTVNPKTSVEPKQIHIKMTGLFNNDQTLGTQMSKFIQENSREVYDTMSPGIFEAFAQAIGAIVDKIARAMSFQDAFPEHLPHN
ncbi:protein takeout-like [Periplaneta americana]|uniref:protein takeout-like n=1 Tax=Periplaneta americana TaxID=6978 RepID=UPI0037E8E415